MDIYDSLSCPHGALNEQIARQIFGVLGDNGPVMVIMDNEGNCWPSDSEKYAKLNLSDSFVADLRSKIDDGCEPIVTDVEGSSIIGSQLVTERTNCGYVIVALPQYSPESMQINIDLIELLLNQFNVIATLIEKSNMLYELQVKHLSMYSAGAGPSS